MSMSTLSGARPSRRSPDLPRGGRSQNSNCEESVVNGGSIFAMGQTDIDDPDSQLHERLDTGVDGRGAYLSVDTSKFTLGPAMAVQTADRVHALIGAAG